MLPSKQILVAVIWEVTTFITIISGIANARSVYVISDTGTYEYSVPVIQAYEIQGNGLIYQKDYNSVYPMCDKHCNRYRVSISIYNSRICFWAKSW